MPNLLANVLLTTSGTAPATYGLMPGMTATVNVTDANSVILLVASVPMAMADGGSHSTYTAQFAVGGVREGPEQDLGYQDQDDLGLSGTIVYALTGLSGSQTFSLQWLDGTSDVTATLDTGRTRSFQVIELLDAEANLLVDIELTTSGSAPGTYADIPGFSATPTVDSTDSVLLMISNMAGIQSGGDATADMRFAVGGTREGPESTWFYSDNVLEKAGTVLTHVKTGITGAQTLSCQWQARKGTLDIDTTRPRTFQVVELLTTDILVDVLATTTGGTAPVTYADVPLLTGTPTVGDAGSVLLMGAHVPIVIDATDRAADVRFAQNGTREGPEITGIYSDNTDEGAHAGIVYAKTGVSGSQTFSLQWQRRSSTPALDTGRTRSLWVLEIKAAFAIFNQAVAATAIGVATVTETTIFARAIAAVGVGVATVSRTACFFRQIAATAVGVVGNIPAVIKGMGTALILQRRRRRFHGKRG